MDQIRMKYCAHHHRRVASSAIHGVTSKSTIKLARAIVRSPTAAAAIFVFFLNRMTLMGGLWAVYYMWACVKVTRGWEQQVATVNTRELLEHF